MENIASGLAAVTLGGLVKAGGAVLKVNGARVKVLKAPEELLFLSLQIEALEPVLEVASRLCTRHKVAPLLRQSVALARLTISSCEALLSSEAIPNDDQSWGQWLSRKHNHLSRADQIPRLEARLASAVGALQLALTAIQVHCPGFHHSSPFCFIPDALDTAERFLVEFESGRVSSSGLQLGAGNVSVLMQAPCTNKARTEFMDVGKHTLWLKSPGNLVLWFEPDSQAVSDMSVPEEGYTLPLHKSCSIARRLPDDAEGEGQGLSYCFQGDERKFIVSFEEGVVSAEVLELLIHLAIKLDGGKQQLNTLNLDGEASVLELCQDLQLRPPETPACKSVEFVEATTA